MTATSALLVIGGDGLIGRALAAAARKRGLRVLTTSRRPGQGDIALDLGDPASWPALPLVGGAVITAAVARLAACQSDPASALAVNVTAPALLAARLRTAGDWCLSLSSDKVFDGQVPLRERDDPPCPRTEYGRQKALGEAAARRGGAAVLRLSKVLDPDLPMLREWRARLAAGEGITPFSDMVLAPVALSGVTALILKLAAGREPGVFHYTGARDLPYADLASSLARALGADPALVRPSATPPDVAAGILVPHSSLEMRREQALYGWSNPSFAEVADEIAAGLAKA